MKMIIQTMIILLFSGLVSGQEPKPEFKPVFKGLTLTSKVERRADGAYVYDYTVFNPSDNTQGVRSVSIDIGNAFANDKPVVINHNSGWVNGILPDIFPEGAGIQWSVTASSAKQTKPGKTVSGLRLITHEPPHICHADVEPDFEEYITRWMQEQHETRSRVPYAKCRNSDEGCMEDKAVQGYPNRVIIPAVLCPLGAVPGSYRHWGTVYNDIDRAWEWGWLKDRKLYDTLQKSFSGADQAALAQDRETMHQKLRIVISTIQSSTPEQRTDEGYALINFNALYLTQTEPYPCSPILWIEEHRDTRPVTTSFTLPVTLRNLGKLVAESELVFEVIKGPNTGYTWKGRTNLKGVLYFRYSSRSTGRDVISVHAPFSAATLRMRESNPKYRPGEKQVYQTNANSPDCRGLKDLYSEDTSVKWVALTKQNARQEGPDLVLDSVQPPMINSNPGLPVFMGDTTRNAGTVAAPSTITRYFISFSPEMTPGNRVKLGERIVPPLEAEEKDEAPQTRFTIPASFPSGNYYLSTCVDADDAVKEMDESNNCVSQPLFGITSAVKQR